MNRVFLAGAVTDQRAPLRVLLEELEMQVVGESAGWSSTLNMGPTTHPDVVAVDWGLISSRSVAALRELRTAFPAAVLIVFPGLMGAVQRSKLIYESGEST
jgi:DNA-binding NarL/FixJ family response regulator